MRLDLRNVDAQQITKGLLEVGHGTKINEDGTVQFSDRTRVFTVNDLIESTYPAINHTPAPPPDYFWNRLIVAARNTDVRELNEAILERLSGEPRQFLSADTIQPKPGANPNIVDSPPIEVLRDIQASNLPPGTLNLKVGCPVVLLCNISPSTGLYIGARLIITRMQNRVLEVQVVGGEHDGELAFLPRVPIVHTSTALKFDLKRLQFPIRLAFALSINEAQGRSVQHIGLDLRTPVSYHGQLYVALSRAKNSENVKILLSDDTAGP